MKLKFQPGVVSDVTTYTDGNGWASSNLVRFKTGLPQSIGGWQKYSNNTFLGTCRSLHNWSELSGAVYLGVGTHLKFYIEEGGSYNDITPIYATSSLTDPFTVGYDYLDGNITSSATEIDLVDGSSFPTQGVVKIDNEIIFFVGRDGNTLQNCTRGQQGTTAASHTSGADVSCSVLRVTDAANTVQDGDYFTISGATGLGGNITAEVLNQNWAVCHKDSAEVFCFNTGVFPTTSDTGQGGSVTIKYDVPIGLDTMVGGTGWGAGSWGRGSWGSGADVTVAGQLRIWFQDNFGEDLIFNIYNGGIYYWDASTGITSRGVELSSLSSDTTVPTVAKQILVSDKDRHVIAFGCDPGNGVQDEMLIRFSDQENPYVWENLPTNTAGELRLGSGSYIMRAVETKREIVVFTDSAVYSMQFLGPPDTFGVQQIAANTTLIGPLAAVSVDDVVFWMGERSFYVYDGSVQSLPCTVRDYVFNNLNYEEMDKVYAAHNAQFKEVTWYFPYGTNTSNSNYVTYNYSEKVWYFGALARSAWMDVSLKDYPIGASTNGYLYNHELGTDADTEAMNSYIESGAIEVGEGDKFMLISRVIPDIYFVGSTSSSPSVTMTFKASNFPGSNIAQTDTAGTTRTATSPITQFTPYVDLRLRGRQVFFRVEKNTKGTQFSLGTPRIEARLDGRR